MPKTLLSRTLGALCCVATALWFSGCATAPVTYRTRTDAAELASKLTSVNGAPLDISVEQISAGGSTEKHDELTALVGTNVTSAFAKNHGYTLSAPGPEWQAPELRQELEEVQALLRAIYITTGGIYRAQPAPAAFDHRVGRIDRIADALRSDAVLFVLVRDQYSTGGRKAVMVLGMLAGAAAGVAIAPPMGLTASCAALVDRDGRILWLNNLGAAGLDLRNPANADNWVKRLMDGYPKLPTPAAPAPRGLEAVRAE